MQCRSCGEGDEAKELVFHEALAGHPEGPLAWSSKWRLALVEDVLYLSRSALEKYIKSSNCAIWRDNDFLWQYSSSQCVALLPAVFIES